MPSYLDADQLSAHAQDLKRWLLLQTGGITTAAEVTTLPEETLRTLAGDLWLAQQESPDTAGAQLLNQLAQHAQHEVTLWDNSPTLDQLTHLRSAVAVVPLDTGSISQPAFDNSSLIPQTHHYDDKDQSLRDYLEVAIQHIGVGSTGSGAHGTPEAGAGGTTGGDSPAASRGHRRPGPDQAPGRGQQPHPQGLGPVCGDERSTKGLAGLACQVFDQAWLDSLEFLSSGHEHSTFRQPNRAEWRIKVTGPDLRLINGQPRPTPYSILAYLESMQLSNLVFGDQIQFLGIIPHELGPRIVIRQPEVVAADMDTPHPDKPAINDWLSKAGFDYQSGAWVRQADGVEVSDEHEGNFIATADGLRPIDVHVRRIADSQSPLITWDLNPIHGTRPLAPVAGDLMRLWIVRSEELKAQDHRHLLQDGLEFMLRHKEIAVFIEPARLCMGTSWQLAASLAIRALDDPGAARRLARDWFITGAIGPEQRVDRVRLGDKLTLAKESQRAWMMPVDAWSQEEDISRRMLTQRLALVDNVDTAWSILSGAGTLADSDGPWPTGGTLHAFVSGSLRPLLLSILLAQPARLVLWVSPDMVENHRRLLEVLTDWKGKALHDMQITKRDVESSDIRKAEQLLLQDSSLSQMKEPVLFNFTGGNLLMRLAVTQLAQLNPALTLIYRDKDEAEPTYFTTVRYERRQARSGRLTTHQSYPEAVADYAKLAATVPPDQDSAHQLNQLFGIKETPNRKSKRL